MRASADKQRQASALIGLLAYVGASVILGAVLAFPVYVVLEERVNPAFDSVLHRVAGLTLLALLPLYLASGAVGGPTRPDVPRASRDAGGERRTGRSAVIDRDALGFGCSARTFRRSFVRGFVVGMVVVVPLIAAFLVLGVRAPTPSAAPVGGVIVHLVQALIAAIVIGLIEEAYFRGALLAPLQHLPAWLAVSIVSLVYAGMHFLGAPVPDDDVTWSSGLASVARSELPLDGILALTAAGLFLGALRYRFGHIGVGAGVHAGWVFLMKINQEYTDVVPGSTWSFLEGTFGGTMGYLGLAWVALLGAGWFVWERTQRSQRGGTPAG